jgi:prepilin-type N-terminal cleavage/methylation domain-containing protein
MVPMSRLTGPGGERGVTLIELLVTMILLTVALVGLAASFPLALFGVTTGGYQTTATLLAQKCIDNAKAMAYDQLAAALPTVCPTGPVTGYSGFTQTLLVEPGPTADGIVSGTATRVTITVSFKSQAAGTSNDTVMATVIAQ